MPSGYPEKFELHPAPLVRVVVYLEQRALEDLELIARHRHGPRSRSQIVREAIDWQLAKEAGWLLGARRQRARRRREAAELAAARELPREVRDDLAREQLVDEARAAIEAGD